MYKCVILCVNKSISISIKRLVLKILEILKYILWHIVNRHKLLEGLTKISLLRFYIEYQ